MKKNGISKEQCESAKAAGKPSENTKIPGPMSKVKYVPPKALEEMASGTRKKGK